MRLLLPLLLLLTLYSQAQLSPTLYYREYIKATFQSINVNIDTIRSENNSLLPIKFTTDNFLIIEKDTFQIESVEELPDTIFRMALTKIERTGKDIFIIPYITARLSPDLLDIEYPPLQEPDSDKEAYISYYYILVRQMKSVSN